MPNVQEEKIEFTWQDGKPGSFWLLQPHDDCLAGPPFRPRTTDECVFPLLQAALAAEIRQRPNPMPAVFIAPELSIHPAHLAQVIECIRNAPPEYLFILGIGHLTGEQCETIEVGISDPSLWDFPARPGIFANGAIVATGGPVAKHFFEGKNHPSKFERDCHWPHSRARVFANDTFRFAVVICSEVLPSTNGVFDNLPNGRHELDVLFWIQHNPKPRDASFVGSLKKLLSKSTSRTLVICANVQPRYRASGGYGVSGFIAVDAHLFESGQALDRNDLVIETMSDGKAGIARGLLINYSAQVHNIRTVLPRDVPSALGRDPRSGFLQYSIPYAYDTSSSELKSWEQNAAVQELLESARPLGERESRLEQSRIEGLYDARLDVEKRLNNPRALLQFLDYALIQTAPEHLHPNHVLHQPPPACACWEHRTDFDSLFRVSSQERIGELVLAVAAMKGRISYDGDSCNVCVDGHRLLVVVDTNDSEEFERRYFRVPLRASRVPAIVLRSHHRNLPQNAARMPRSGSIDAGTTQLPSPPRLYGRAFWRAVGSNDVAAKIARLCRSTQS